MWSFAVFMQKPNYVRKGEIYCDKTFFCYSSCNSFFAYLLFLFYVRYG